MPRSPSADEDLVALNVLIRQRHFKAIEEYAQREDLGPADCVSDALEVWTLAEQVWREGGFVVLNYHDGKTERVDKIR